MNTVAISGPARSVVLPWEPSLGEGNQELLSGKAILFQAWALNNGRLFD